MDKEQYQQLVRQMAPRPKVLRDVIRAFLVGGGICLVGEAILQIFIGMEPSRAEAQATTLAAMIFLGALFTALGVYDRLGEFAGAGAAVPITGFSNTVVAAAMDFRREGLVLGMASKMFIIAGPVLVYGLVSGFTVGLIRAAFLGYFH